MTIDLTYTSEDLADKAETWLAYAQKHKDLFVAMGMHGSCLLLAIQSLLIQALMDIDDYESEEDRLGIFSSTFCTIVFFYLPNQDRKLLFGACRFPVDNIPREIIHFLMEIEGVVLKLMEVDVLALYDEGGK